MVIIVELPSTARATMRYAKRHTICGDLRMTGKMAGSVGDHPAAMFWAPGVSFAAVKLLMLVMWCNTWTHFFSPLVSSECRLAFTDFHLLAVVLRLRKTASAGK